MLKIRPMMLAVSLASSVSGLALVSSGASAQTLQDEGNAAGQWFLGTMYIEGYGVPQNYAIAHMWLNLGAARGNIEAAKQRDALTAEMTSEQIAEAQRLAREWKPGQK